MMLDQTQEKNLRKIVGSPRDDCAQNMITMVTTAD